MDNFEKYISKQLLTDKLTFEADPGIHDRLMYQMQLKSSNSSVRKNQFFPSLTTLFTTQLIAWKLGVAGLFLISLMGYNHFNHTSTNSHFVDTVQVMHFVDTTNFMIEDSASIN